MCGWVCVIGTKWVCDPNVGCTCPEEERCTPPAHAGASGDKDTTPCLPVGSGTGIAGSGGGGLT